MLSMLENSREEGNSMRPVREYNTEPFSSRNNSTSIEKVVGNVEQLIAEGRLEEASLLSYGALTSLCESNPGLAGSFLNNLVYGPYSKSIPATLTLIHLLTAKGFPPSCTDQIAVLPLSIVYSVPQGSILENDALVKAVFGLIEKLLHTALTEPVPLEKLHTVYLELNTFLSEFSKVLSENGGAAKFRALFAQIETMWTRLVSTLFSGSDTFT